MPQSSASAPPHVCLNCGAEMEGRYCSACGQEEHSLAVPLHRMVLDFLSDQFQFDARIWRTLHLLLFRPGRLTREYLSGKRQRHIPPVRLYLFISIVFFLTVELLPAKLTQFQVPSYELHPAVPAAATAIGAAASNTAQRARRALSPGAATSLDSAVNSKLLQVMRGKSPAAINGVRHFEDWLVKHSLAAKANPGQFQREFWSNAPKVLFFLIPVFALLLQLLYLLRRRYYSEHLVFALHYHSVVFLNVLVIVLVSVGVRSAPALLASILHWCGGLLTLWTVLYIFPALHTAYADTWPRAIGRGLILGLIYGIALLFGTAAAVMVTFAIGA
ncbi:MAG: DUF3667 domain-containing protein [Gammaproteobacteria bacterium]